MRLSPYLKKKLPVLLISRTVIFLFIMCLLSLLLYTAGTMQGFTDSTQLTLLGLAAVLGAFLAISSAGGMIFSLIRFFRLKTPGNFLKVLAYTVLVVFGAASVFAAMVVITIAGGNAGV